MEGRAYFTYDGRYRALVPLVHLRGRATVLAGAYHAHPERFAQTASPSGAAAHIWINPHQEKEAAAQ